MAEHKQTHSPSARFVSMQDVTPSEGVRINAKPEPVQVESSTVTPRKPSVMILTPVGPRHQKAPDVNGAEFIDNPTMPIRPSAAQVTQGIAVQQAMSRIDPLDKFMAAHRAKAGGVERPAEKLVMGKTQGMQM